MQQSAALSIGLPVVLAVIMLGLGLSLSMADFRRVLTRPMPVVVGLVCQLVILPPICVAIVVLFDLPPAMAVGMMLLSASPGATSATLYTHLARGDVALSIVLAGLTSGLSLLTIPLIGNFAVAHFYGDAGLVYLEVTQVLQIFVIAIVPALIGVTIRGAYPDMARRLEKPVKLAATLFLLIVVVGALVGQRELLSIWGPTLGVAILVFNLTSLAVGYLVPRLLGLAGAQAIALCMSISMHNAALVIAVAMSETMLNNPDMAIPPAGYGLFSYITSGVAVLLFTRLRRR